VARAVEGFGGEDGITAGPEAGVVSRPRPHSRPTTLRREPVKSDLVAHALLLVSNSEEIH
jgi:hypothetical protein